MSPARVRTLSRCHRKGRLRCERSAKAWHPAHGRSVLRGILVSGERPARENTIAWPSREVRYGQARFWIKFDTCRLSDLDSEQYGEKPDDADHDESNGEPQ